MILLRVLPIEEFAIYALALSATQIIALASDFGLSHAVTAEIGKTAKSRSKNGAIYNASIGIAVRYFCIALVFCLPLFSLILWKMQTTIYQTIILVLAVATIALLQFGQALRRAAVAANGDIKSINSIGFAEAVTRLVGFGLCTILPTAVAALAVTGLGAIVARQISLRRCQLHVDLNQQSTVEQRSTLLHFASPLIAVIIYQSIQSQSATYILAISGLTLAIAELNALARLGQMVAILMAVNTFIVQPTFARITNENCFRSRSLKVVAAVVSLSALVFWSTYLMPSLWLALLGSKYARLSEELPIAVAAPLCMLIGGTIYSIVISKVGTRFQFLYAPLGIAAQASHFILFGISGTSDALFFNLLAAVLYVVLQLSIMSYIFVQRRI